MSSTVTAATLRRQNLGNLEQRVANQEGRINRGVKAGTLSQTEATTLRSRLSSVQTSMQNDAFDGNGLSRGKDADKRLRGIGKDIHAKKADSQVDVAKRADHIDRRIENGLKNGSLTQTEADALQSKSTALRTEMAAATTPEAKQAVAQKLAALSKEVHAEKHDAEMDAGKRVESFKNRIAAGVADGSLSQEEAAKLTERAGALGSTPDAKTVNSLNRDIFQQRHDKNVNTTAAGQSLTTRINDLAASGKLTPDQVSSFQAQLAQLGPDAKAAGPRMNVLRAKLDAIAA